MVGRRSAEPFARGLLARHSPRHQRLGGTSPYPFPLPRPSTLNSSPRWGDAPRSRSHVDSPRVFRRDAHGSVEPRPTTSPSDLSALSSQLSASPPRWGDAPQSRSHVDSLRVISPRRQRLGGTSPYHFPLPRPSTLNSSPRWGDAPRSRSHVDSPRVFRRDAHGSVEPRPTTSPSDLSALSSQLSASPPRWGDAPQSRSHVDSLRVISPRRPRLGGTSPYHFPLTAYPLPALHELQTLPPSINRTGSSRTSPDRSVRPVHCAGLPRQSLLSARSLSSGRLPPGSLCGARLHRARSPAPTVDSDR